jgi:hypothetical protein
VAVVITHNPLSQDGKAIMVLSKVVVSHDLYTSSRRS